MCCLDSKLTKRRPNDYLLDGLMLEGNGALRRFMFPLWARLRRELKLPQTGQLAFQSWLWVHGLRKGLSDGKYRRGLGSYNFFGAIL